jgi:hypothetical protein
MSEIIEITVFPTPEFDILTQLIGFKLTRGGVY